MEGEIAKAIAQNLGLVGLFGFLALLAMLATVRELVRMRLDIARQRSDDLFKRRFEAYGKLWAQTHQLAVYSSDSFGADAVSFTSTGLTMWYFSDEGGMLLSASARDFYFALQKTLKAFAKATAMRSVEHTDGRDTFVSMLEFDRVIAAKYRKCRDTFLSEKPEKMPVVEWIEFCEALSTLVLDVLEKDAAIGSHLAFCMTQQVSSTLRTRLTYELRSRLDSTPKWWRLW